MKHTIGYILYCAPLEGMSGDVPKILGVLIGGQSAPTFRVQAMTLARAHHATVYNEELKAEWKAGETSMELISTSKIKVRYHFKSVGVWQ